MHPQRIWPVLLSGGAGTRLWPLSRQALPKQLIALAGPQTMLQATALRVADRALYESPIVVGNADHVAQIVGQLGELGISPQLILEPCARNTAPALVLAALEIARHDPTGLMLALPSDHLIGDTGAFARAVAAAQVAAADGWLVTLGIAAETPETGYGYIETGETLFTGVNRAVRFVEKPDRATAETYVASGRFAWNGGYVVARVDVLIATIKALAPDILDACTAAHDHAVRDGNLVFPDHGDFARCTSESFDYAVLERADKVAVVPVSMGWSDIGSWDALREVGTRDGDGNALRGRVIAIDTHDCLVRSDGPVVATIGVHDLNIVVTADAVLVTAAGRAQDVKFAVNELKGDRVLADHLSTGEAWGIRRKLTAGPGGGAEEIMLAAGATWPDARGEIIVIAGAVAIDGIGHAAGARVKLARGAVTATEAATLLCITSPASD